MTGTGPIKTTLAAEHQRLSEWAADEANSDKRLGQVIPNVEREATKVFYAASGKTKLGQRKHGGFTIEFDEAWLSVLSTEQIAALRQIGADAIRRTLMGHPDAIAGLFLGDAKRGQNYFARFKKGSTHAPVPQPYIKPNRHPKRPDYYGDQQSFDL